MKRFFYLLVAVMFLSAIPEVSCAQSNDPFEQKTLKTSSKDKNREKKVGRKKQQPKTQEVKPQEVKNEEAAPEKQPVVIQELKVAQDEMTISNPCAEWLDVEFVSLIGSKATQTINLTLKITNHDVNKDMNIGGNFVAYDREGDEHSRGWAPEHHKAMTDVPLKTSFEIPGKINPNKTKSMPVMTFKIGECSIEMKNVPIDWK